MPRQQVGLRAHDFCKLPLQDVADAVMQLLPLATRQGAVSDFLYQGMFEGVLGIRCGSPPEDQFGAHQLCQSIIDLLLRHLRDRSDQFVRE
jgi:hypothetical protein